MSDLDRVIQVTVSAQTKAIAATTFAVAGLVCYHTLFPERSRLYTDLTGMVDDGFPVTGPESGPYRMAEALKGQTPEVPNFKILRRDLVFTDVVRLVAGSVVVGARYHFVFGGVEVDYTVLTGDDQAEIATAWKTQIDAGPLAVTATVTGAGATGALNLTSDVPGEQFELTIEADATHGALSVDVTTADPGLATDLAAIQAADDDWYALHIDSQSKAQIVAAAAFAQANGKLFVPSTPETACKSSGSSTDVMATIETSAYSRTGVMFHSHVNGFADCAWDGVNLAFPPGSATAKFKTLAGPGIDKFTSAELATIADKHGNCYPSLGGNGSTEEGWASDGTFLDQTRFLDWLVAEIQTEVALELVNSPKVPMSNAGIARIEARFRAAMKRGVDAGGIDGDRALTYTIPKIGDVSQNDRALRKLSGLKCTFYLAGAIHSVKTIDLTALV